jgi:hypothetical protein
MAAFGFSSTQASIYIGGMKSWKVISAGDATGTIDLGKLFDGNLAVSALTRKDSYGRSLPYAADVVASAKLMSTHKTSVLELLGSLYGPCLQEIALINGLFLTANAAATHTLGLGWKFDSSQDYDGMRYIEVSAKGKILLDGTDFDVADLFASATSIGSSIPAAGMAAWSAVGYYPSGMTAFEIRNAGESNWETLGLFRGGKLVAETIDLTDNHGRNIPYAIRVSVEAEMLQTSLAEIERMDDVSAGSPDFKVTLADGATFIMADNCGVSWAYSNATDSDGVATIRITGDGVVLLADWAGLVA